jgi:hypothetical protein
MGVHIMDIELNKYIQTLTEMVMKIIRQTHLLWIWKNRIQDWVKDYKYDKDVILFILVGSKLLFEWISQTFRKGWELFIFSSI